MDGETVTPEATPPRRGVVDWFALNPRIGLLGTIASVIGIPLGVALFFLAQADRDIRYSVSASPTTIVKAGQSSDLRVLFKDKDLNSDVSSIQVAIWNAGKESVKRDNILSKTMVLELEPPTSILEARIKRVTRNLVNFQVDSSANSPGILKLSWDILEQGDGAVLELIYTGTSERVVVTGAIEGKKPITRVLAENEPDPLFKKEFWEVVGFSMLIGLLRSIRTYRSNRSTMSPLAATISAVADGVIWSLTGLCVALSLIGGYFAWGRPSIPFSL